MTFHAPDQLRVKTGRLASPDSYGCNGAFLLKIGGQMLRLLASDGGGWEHVSASYSNRCPTWDEMCQIKRLFWDAEDVVIQYHPAESEYVNLHPFALHLWRPIGVELPTPPKFMVG